MKSRSALFAALVFFTALAARLSYLASIHLSPFYDVGFLRGTDSFSFFVWAMEISEKNDLIGHGVYNQSPLYAYFLALIFELAGGGHIILPRLVQMVIGSLTALLVYRIGKEWRGPATGLAGGLITALYGPLIFYDGAILRDGLIAFLNVALICSMMSARKRPGLPRGALTGLIFGAAYIGKPNIAIMLPALAWWLWDSGRPWPEASLPESKKTGEIEGRSRESQTFAPASRTPRARIMLAAGFGAGLIIVLSPLAARNLAAGVPLFSTTQRGALEFISGNHPEMDAFGWDVNESVFELEKKSGKSLTRSVFLVLSLYRDRPLDLVKKQVDKTLVFLWGYEMPNNLNIYVEKRYVPFFRMPWLNWPMALGFGLVGMWLCRREWRRGFEIYSYLVLYSMATIGFYVISRFRVPLTPMLGLMAGAALIEIFAMAKDRRFAKASAALLAASLVIAAVWPRIPDYFRPNDYHNLIRYHLILGQPGAARQWAEEGMAKAETMVKEEDSAESRVRLARLLYITGAPLDEIGEQIKLARAKDPLLPTLKLLEEMEKALKARRAAGDPLSEGYRL